MGDGRTCPGTGARQAFGAGAGSACSAAGPGCPLFSLQLPRPARRNAALGPPAAASREPEARAWGSPGVPREPTAGPACLLHRGPHPPGRPRAPRPRSPRRPGVERASCCHEQQVASAWCSCRLGRGSFLSPQQRQSSFHSVKAALDDGQVYRVPAEAHGFGLTSRGRLWLGMGLSSPSHRGVQPLRYVSQV